MQILSNLSANNLSGNNSGDQDLSGKQNLLISGTNIKTVNGTSLLGSGNITTSGSGTVTSVAKGNGMNFTTFTTTGTVTLGTPSTLTSSTTNALTSTSHTHAVTGLIPETSYLLVDTTICNSTDNGDLTAAGQQIQWVKQTGGLTMTSGVLTLPAGYLYNFELSPEIWNANSYVSFDLRNTSTSATVLSTKACASSGTALGSSSTGFGVLDLTSGSKTNIGFYVNAITAACKIGQSGGCIIRKYKKVTI